MLGSTASMPLLMNSSTNVTVVWSPPMKTVPVVDDVAGDEVGAAGERNLVSIDDVGIEPHDGVLADDFAAGAAVGGNGGPGSKGRFRKGRVWFVGRRNGDQVALEFDLGGASGVPCDLDQAVVGEGIFLVSVLTGMLSGWV